MKYLIFDCDGTLFKTEELSKKAFFDIADKQGIELDEAFFNTLHGTTKEEIIKRLANIGIEASYFENVHSYWKEMINEAIKTKDSLCKEGFYKLFDYLNEHDYTVAIATSSNIDHLEKLLNHLSKPINVKVMTTGNMVTHSKPHPEIFLKTMESLKADAKDCLVIEDSANGLLSAKSANIQRCYIKDIDEVNQEVLKDVEYRIESLDELIPILEKM